MSRVVVFDEPGPPEVLRVVDKEPVAPTAGEVRVRLEAIGVNRLDQLIRSGHAPRPIRLPGARVGIEGTGVIDAVGPDVVGLRIGDGVIITAVPDMDVNGTYAEHVTLPATRVFARPPTLGPTEAAGIWVAYSTAYGALVEKAKLQPGQSVLITAASSALGLAAIQLANYIGAVPIAVTRHAAKKASLAKAGAAQVVTTEELVGVTVDVILDCVMGPGLAELSKSLRPGGTLVAAGWMDPRPPTFPMGAITLHRYMSFEHTLDPHVVARMAAFLGAALRTGSLRPAIEREFRLDDVVAAHRFLEEDHQLGKIVVTV